MKQRTLVWATAVVMAAMASPTHAALPDFPVRALFNMGAWSGAFHQSDTVNTIKQTTTPSPGLQAQLGAKFSIFFVEYNVAWLISLTNPTPSARDATYWSWLGGNAGIAFPFLPIEVYAGGERGTYTLSGGVSPDYSGLAWKAGVNLLFGAGKGRFGLKGEYRRLGITADERGALPANINTRAETYFVGIAWGLL